MEAGGRGSNPVAITRNPHHFGGGFFILSTCLSERCKKYSFLTTGS